MWLDKADTGLQMTREICPRYENRSSKGVGYGATIHFASPLDHWNQSEVSS